MPTDEMDFRGALVDEVLPFWERSVDREQGGFITEIDADGQRVGAGEKYIVMQTRMIYSFALGYRLTGNPHYLAHAAQGVDFFTRHFRDERHGGWYRTTTRQGEPLDRSKWPYGIAFAVYALADYHRASGDGAALTLAVETYDLHWRHAWDAQRGGIAWQLAEDWSATDPTKRIDSMLHTMEAASSLLAATGDRRYLADLTTLCDTIVERTYDAAHGCTLEWFTPDWQEVTSRTRGLVNYGHIAEAAWFIASVAAHTGHATHRDFARALLGYVLRRGWDARHGGIAAHGRPAGGVVDPDKVWWMQAELLGGLALAYRQTGDPFYVAWLRDQARFIFERQRDAAVGEWHSTVYADGTVRDGRKGSMSKAAYHVAQGLAHADRNLRLLAERGPINASGRETRWEDLAL